MTLVHLIYPHGDRISCPDAIGRKLAERLATRYEVELHDWDELRPIRPHPDAVLLGHPHPMPFTVFRRSAASPGWRRVVMLSPFNLDPQQVAFADPVLPRCDRYLAISGSYWFDRIGASPFRRWLPRMTHLDLAVDPVDFPRVKRRFAPSGRRKLLYIGHAGWQKNTSYLSEIAARLPGVEASWIGGPRGSVEGFRAFGPQDFRRPEARALVADHDLSITVGRHDAGPATVLESMAWGLVPACTPQSGYEGYPGIVALPLDDAERAAALLREQLEAPEASLDEMRGMNDELLASQFTWERFAAEVVEAIEADDRAPLAPGSAIERLRLAWLSLISPYSPVRPTMLRTVIRSELHRRR